MSDHSFTYVGNQYFTVESQPGHSLHAFMIFDSNLTANDICLSFHCNRDWIIVQGNGTEAGKYNLLFRLQPGGVAGSDECANQYLFVTSATPLDTGLTIEWTSDSNDDGDETVTVPGTAFTSGTTYSLVYKPEMSYGLGRPTDTAGNQIVGSISVPGGWKLIDDIKEGDMISTLHGGKYPVKQLKGEYQPGEIPTGHILIKNPDGSMTPASEDKIIRVQGRPMKIKELVKYFYSIKY